MNPPVHIEGLKELRRDLKRLGGPEMVKELRETLKGGAEIAAGKARGLAPYRSGRLAGMIKAGTSGPKAFIKADLPYAAVHEYGGNVGRNKATKITGKSYMGRAVESSADRITEDVAQAVEDLANRLGWRRGI